MSLCQHVYAYSCTYLDAGVHTLIGEHLSLYLFSCKYTRIGTGFALEIHFGLLRLKRHACKSGSGVSEQRLIAESWVLSGYFCCLWNAPTSVRNHRSKGLVDEIFNLQAAHRTLKSNIDEAPLREAPKHQPILGRLSLYFEEASCAALKRHVQLEHVLLAAAAACQLPTDRNRQRVSASRGCLA